MVSWQWVVVQQNSLPKDIVFTISLCGFNKKLVICLEETSVGGYQTEKPHQDQEFLY